MAGDEQGFPQSPALSGSLARRIAELQGVRDDYASREESLAGENLLEPTGLSLGEGLASAVVGLLPLLIGKAAGGKYGGVYGAKAGAQSGDLFNKLVLDEKERKRKTLVDLVPQLAARRQGIEGQINKLEETQEKERNDFLQQQSTNELRKEISEGNRAVQREAIAAREDARADREAAKQLSEPFAQAMMSSLENVNKELESAGMPKIPISAPQTIADQTALQKIIEQGQRQAEEGRRVQEQVTREFNRVQETTGPVFAASGKLKVFENGSVAEPDKQQARDAISWQRGKQTMGALLSELKKFIQQDGLYIDVTTEPGKIAAKNLQQYIAAIEQEYGGTSIFRQNGITEKELQFLKKILPSDINTLDKLTKTGGVRLKSAELRGIENLSNIFRTKTKAVEDATGVLFPDSEGKYSSNVAGLPELLSYRAMKTGNPRLAERGEALTRGFIEYQKFQKLKEKNPAIEKQLVFDPIAGRYKKREFPLE